MFPIGMLGPWLFDDSGHNIPESIETLKAQQSQLIDGLRPAQMFPLNSRELDVPQGCERVETRRGVFHFNPGITSKDEICRLSAARRENELLGLGPFNKADVLERIEAGESLVVVTERTSDGIEVRAAAGTPSLALVQIPFFERTKSNGNVIGVESIMDTISRRQSARA